MDLDELARAVIDGQPGAWTPLVRRLTRELRPYFAREVGEADARDLVQKTLLVIARKLSSFDMTRGSFASWAFGVARIELREARRQRRRRWSLHSMVASVAPSPATSPSSRVRWRERRELVDEEIQRLPDLYRRALEHERAGGDMATLAELEGISRAAARSRCHRAREQVTRRVQRRLAGASASSTTTRR